MIGRALENNEARKGKERCIIGHYSWNDVEVSNNED